VLLLGRLWCGVVLSESLDCGVYHGLNQLCLLGSVAPLLPLLLVPVPQHLVSLVKLDLLLVLPVLLFWVQLAGPPVGGLVPPLPLLLVLVSLALPVTLPLLLVLGMLLAAPERLSSLLAAAELLQPAAHRDSTLALLLLLQRLLCSSARFFGLALVSPVLLLHCHGKLPGLASAPHVLFLLLLLAAAPALSAWVLSLALLGRVAASVELPLPLVQLHLLKLPEMPLVVLQLGRS
jgi:hypothetical protein